MTRGPRPPSFRRVAIAGLFSALVASALGWAIVEHGGPTDCAFLGRTGDFPSGSVVAPRCAPVYVVTVGTRRTVFLDRVPHLPGERMRWDPASGTFYSPSHGERFSQAGAVLDGPASRPLWTCPLEERGDQLWLRMPPGADPELIVAVCQASSS